MNETILQLLSKARKQGIVVFFAEDKLKLKVDKGKTLDLQLLEAIKQNKTAILQFLKKNASQQQAANDQFDALRAIPRTAQTCIPLSFAQERIWFIDQLEGSLHYHIPAVLRMEGSLDLAALDQAFQQLVERHEILRTVYKEDRGKAYQQVMPSEAYRIGTSDWSEGFEERDLTTHIQSILDRPFVLSSDFMLRVEVIKVAEEAYVLVMVLHHIAADGWSAAILVNELVAAYQAKLEGQQNNWPPLPIQYADYAFWQRDHLGEKQMADSLNWWEEKLLNHRALDLPLDFARPKIQSTQGAQFNLTLPQALSQQLQTISKEAEATLFMTLLAAFKALLHGYTGQEDICIGTTIANRSAKKVEGLIGLFVNTLVLRTQLNATQSFSSLLEQVKTETLEVYQHQDIPFERIVNRVAPDRDRSRNPIFQVLFEMQNVPKAATISLDHLNLNIHPEDTQSAKFDLRFSISEKEGEIQIAMIYCKDLFKASSIQHLGRRYVQLLAQIVEAPEKAIGQLTWLEEEELHWIAQSSRGEDQAAFRGQTLLHLLDHQVKQSLNQVALYFGQASMSYRELANRSDQLAAYLMDQGIGPGDRVGICLDRSFNLMIGLLGILKTGAAYVPISPQYPIHRIGHLIEDAQLKYVLTDAANRELGANFPNTKWLYEHWEKINGQATTKGSNLQLPTATDTAYLLYTSGSTGQPKGVVVAHESLANYLLWAKAYYTEGQAISMPLYTNMGFDLTLTSLFLPLISGGQVIISKEEKEGSAALLSVLADQRIN
ncbi:MAG: condensation domain-containing protein, partial [Bacteroidota bacterium]